MAGDEEMPREAFQRLRDSSFWSGWVDVRRKLQGTGKTRELHRDVSGILQRDGRCLQEKRSGVCLGEYSHIDAAKKFSTS